MKLAVGVNNRDLGECVTDCSRVESCAVLLEKGDMSERRFIVYV